jgi:hypothetical protein
LVTFPKNCLGGALTERSQEKATIRIFFLEIISGKGMPLGSYYFLQYNYTFSKGKYIAILNVHFLGHPYMHQLGS